MLFSTVNPSDQSVRPSTSSSSQTNQCKGNGGCLILSDNTLSLACDYIQNPAITCHHHCQPKFCPNYLFCKQKCPEWILQCNCGLCDTCSSTFGMRLHFTENPTKSIRCPICASVDTVYVQYKHCEHVACRNCFSFSFFDNVYEYYDIENEPKFPHNKEIEEEYYDDQDDPKWKKDSLIQKYLQDWNKWDENREQYRENFLQLKQNLKKREKGSVAASAITKKGTKEDEEENAVLLGQCPICKK